MSKIIGIDLGTTNSVVAVMEGGEPTVIVSAEGGRTVPSVLAVARDGQRLVGQTAKRQAITNPGNTVFSIKRLMGRRFDDPQVAVAAERMSVALEGDAHSSGVIVHLANGQLLSPPQISARILAKLRADAEAYLGEAVTEAVITVPAYFDDAARQATKDAGQIAGLTVRRIINEPTASALVYGLDRRLHEKIAVYDLGGGTFDISILELGEGVFQVRATNGDTRLGGDDFDARLMDWLMAEFQAEHGVKLQANAQAQQRLKEAAEEAKIELSTALQTEINLPYIAVGPDGPLHLTRVLTRALLEDLVSDLVARTHAPVQAALADAGLRAEEIDQVLLVGGQTRMPAVAEAVRSFFGAEPRQGVNPDEVVALGAAIQGAVLSGEMGDVLLLDVTPLSLGLETKGGVMTKLIGRNTTIPTSKSQIFSTVVPKQSQVEVHILQGERSMTADNKTLGRFILDDIPPAPAGRPRIEVTFDIDANGILEVQAQDLASGREQAVRITSSSMLSRQEVERLVTEAEGQAEDDLLRRARVEHRHAAETLLTRAQRRLEEGAAPLGEEGRLALSAAAETLREALAGEDEAYVQGATRLLATRLVSSVAGEVTD